MSKIKRLIRKELQQCKADIVSDCGLTVRNIKNLQGKPAGTHRQDHANPNYKGKVKTQGDKIVVSLKIMLTGNKERAKAAIKNIQKVYATQNILVNFTLSQSEFDLRIHGATLIELAQGLKACDCKGMLMIGGWGPSYKNHKWGNALLINPRSYWENVDAHEFGHKLGLRHRNNLGIMDYWDQQLYRRDPRKFLPSEKARIQALYN